MLIPMGLPVKAVKKRGRMSDPGAMGGVANIPQ